MAVSFKKMTSQSSSQLNRVNAAANSGKKSYLLELCRKSQLCEYDKSAVDRLMKTIEEQTESKTLLMELFKTIKNIGTDVCIKYR